MLDDVTDLDGPVSAARIASEAMLLGSCMADNRLYGLLRDLEFPFSTGRHLAVYDVIGHLIASGVEADPVTIRDKFIQIGTLDKIGGVQFLADLASVMTSLDYAFRHALDIYDESPFVH